MLPIDEIIFMIMPIKVSLGSKLSFICGNIPSVPAYEVFISQLLRYARACRNYADVFFLSRKTSCNWVSETKLYF